MQNVTKRKREAAAKAAEATRAGRRERAAAAWALGGDVRLRTALEIAAYLCTTRQYSDESDAQLADWLLCAHPDHARIVAAHVAAMAVREGLEPVWDALQAVGAMDYDEASRLYETPGLIPAPKAEWLIWDQVSEDA